MEDYQNILFPYAYNILGSAEDAKDVVQDIMVKFLSMSNRGIENRTGYLIKAVVNQSINIKKRNSKLTRDKTWLPEPLSTENADHSIYQGELISYSLLVLFEKLSATERAVFILKEGFDYSHKEIAEILNLTIENSRKLLSRAKNKLNLIKQPVEVAWVNRKPGYMENYIQMIKKGDVKGLEKLLSEDISLMADGGSEVSVVRELTIGKSATLDLLFYVFQTYQALQNIHISQVNHQPALLFYQGDILVNCQVFELKSNQIRRIYSILDPNKLKLILKV